MKKYALLLMLVWGCNAPQGPGNGETGIEGLRLNSKRSEIPMIDPFPDPNLLSSILDTSTFVTVEMHPILYNKDSSMIIIESIKNWGDPGDYLQFVEVDNRDSVLFKILNLDGWVKFGDNYDVPQTILDQNRIVSDHLLLLRINKSSYLFLFGWVYASSPGIMTVIKLEPRCEVVFNKEFQLNSIVDVDGDGNLDLVGSRNFESIDVVDLANKLLISE